MKPYYEQDGITIFHARCEDVLPTLAAGSVDLVLTDPPYGIAEPTDRAARKRGDRWDCKDWPAIRGDDMPFNPMHLLRFPRLVLFGANNYADRLPPSKGWPVWDKRFGMAANDNGDCELAWTNITGAVRRFAHHWDGVIRDSENGCAVLHPTQKPVALFHWVIASFTDSGALVLDPYMGSGPVLAAAKAMGRRAIGIELEERYCEIAAKRLQQSVLPLAAAL